MLESLSLSSSRGGGGGGGSGGIYLLLSMELLSTELSFSSVVFVLLKRLLYINLWFNINLTLDFVAPRWLNV